MGAALEDVNIAAPTADTKPSIPGTEIVPSGWKLFNLGEICSFENGDRGVNYPSKSDFREFGIPFVNAGHVSDGRFFLESMDYISRDKFDRLGGGKIKAGDILFCLRGSLGKFGVVPNHVDEGTIASSLIIIRPKKALSTSGYLSQFFKSNHCQRMIELWSGGAAQPNLGGRDLARFTVNLPCSLGEQKVIAEALSDADALIEGLEKLIAKKRLIKQGAMQELLTGKRRLPGFSGEWKTVRLGSLCSLKSGEGITSKSINDFSPYPCYGGNGLRGYTATYTHTGRYALIGRVGALCGNVNLVDGHFFASEHAIVATPLDAVCIDWLALVLDDLRLNRFSEASAQPVLTVSKLERLEVSAPIQREEQKEIAGVIAALDTELVALDAKLAKARQIKHGMMQELLTGRIRLV